MPNRNILLILLFALSFILISCKNPDGSEKKGACFTCSDGRDGYERDWKSNGVSKDFSLPLLSISEKIIGVLITDKNVIISKLQVFHENNLVEIDTNVQPSYKEILVEELIRRQLYDPETKLLWFYQTINPVNGDLNDSIHMKIKLNDGTKVTSGILVGIGFRESDLNKGLPLPNVTPTIDDLSTNPSPPQGYYCNLLVDLVKFKTVLHGNDVNLTWITGSEKNNIGFHILRSKNSTGNYEVSHLIEAVQYRQIDPKPNENCSIKIQGQLRADNSNKSFKLISAIGNSTESACYSFTDTNNLDNGTYYYLLESISDNGDSTFHCDQIDAVTVGQGPAIDLESAINYCKEVTGSNN